MDHFTRAQDLVPDPRFRLNLGVAQENLGRLDDALENYQAFLRSQSKGPKADAVREKIRALERAMKDKGKLIITVDPAPDLVAVDGVEFKRLRPVKVWLTPGAHHVLVTRQGYQPQTFKPQVKAGTPAQLEVTLQQQAQELPPDDPVETPPEPSANPAPVDAPPSPAASQAPGSPGPRRPILLAAGAAGAVLTALAALAAVSGVAVAGGIFGAWNTVVGLDRYRLPLNAGLIGALAASGVATVLVPILLGTASAAFVAAFLLG